MIFKALSIFMIVSSLFWLGACQQTGSETTKTPVEAPTTAFDKNTRNFPEWAKNASIYEVNLRQFTPEGTLAAFAKHLPRIKDMGMDILWLMPIHPISQKERKGSLGSPYAVSDYRGVNPEYGTLEEFKALVEQIHSLGMHIIIDWVPNHTGWDHYWITEHPDWYTKDADGKITDPINAETGEPWGWTDVADLDYSQTAMREAMMDELRFWIEEVGIDGFRFDVAHGVPNDFWDEVAETLYAIRPLFLLAESEVPYHVDSGDFIATYAWNFKDVTNSIAAGTKNANDLNTYLTEDRQRFQQGFHMYFTTNHDENSWHGTVFERLGDGHKAFAVLAATLDGMPLVYGGQEAPLQKRLEFFERDPIDWNDYTYASFYKTLMELKHRNKALWNGSYGGEIVRIPTSQDEEVYAFMREKDGDKVVVILNLSAAEPLVIQLSGTDYPGEYTNIFANSTLTLVEGTELSLNAWDYLVLSNR